VLSQQLRQLELDELVLRRVLKAAPRSVSYELTDLGRSLKASLGALATWGRSNYSRLGVRLEWPR